MAELVSRGAEAIILGCTEIELLIGPSDTNVPLSDTTRLHAEAAARALAAAPDFGSGSPAPSEASSDDTALSGC